MTPQNDPDQVAPVAPEPIQEGQPEEPPVAETQSFQPESGIDQQWRTYRVEPCKTLAQLFRDHNLPPTDVYAMAQSRARINRSVTCKMVRLLKSVKMRMGWLPA